MQVQIISGDIEKFCRENGITWLAIFGSALHGPMKSDSDVDILVEFDKPKGLFELVRIENEMSSLFSGRKVDLIVKKGLDKYIRDDVLKSCEVIYAKAG